MNKSPPGLASHYASISTLQIPQHWSDKQALAVWELLDNIAGSVWDRYEFQLIELIQSERCEEDPNQLDLFDPDDPIPFLIAWLKSLPMPARRHHARACRFTLPALLHLL